MKKHVIVLTTIFLFWGCIGKKEVDQEEYNMAEDYLVEEKIIWEDITRVQINQNSNNWRYESSNYEIKRTGNPFTPYFGTIYLYSKDITNEKKWMSISVGFLFDIKEKEWTQIVFGTVELIRDLNIDTTITEEIYHYKNKNFK